MTRYFLSGQGFSLLECLLALALLSSVLLGLLSFIWFLDSNAEKMQEKEESQYFFRAIMHTIMNDIKQAESLSVNQDRNKLTLVLPGNKQVEYYCQEGNVYQQTGSNKVPYAENIGELSFELLGKDWVEIRIKTAGDNIYQVRAACAAWSSRWT